MEKRKMTWKLASELMDCLACLAISAEGGYSENTDLDKVSEYAREKFVEICNEWEETFGFEWDVEENPEAEISE